jgi:UDP-glucose 4,6-dehydratase
LSTDLVNFIIEEYKIDTIFHFAAQTHVDNSFGNSLTFTKNNVLGTHSLLECWRRYQKQIRRFIHVSTDEVYGENKEPETRPSSESKEKASVEFEEANSMLLPTNPYAASKAAAELMVQSYMHSFKLPAIITRGNNVYGPRQYPEKLIPKFIYRLERKQKLCIHGKGSPRRSYLHVADAAEAYEKVFCPVSEPNVVCGYLPRLVVSFRMILARC